ncbi:MAG: hypothetical protein U5K74_05715 [Gemmatimonadaceae bacterium]|nr:hypothetical protein [Gemmatimonadaceae bacterium]
MGHRRGVSAAGPMVGRAIDAARSALRAALGDRVRTAGPDRTEALAQDGAPLLHHASVALLGGSLRTVTVSLPTAATFEGFLDGIQRSTTVAYVDGVPLLHGTAAAAVRARDASGRMSTWRTPAIDHALYASRALLGEGTWVDLAAILGTRGHGLRDSDDALPVTTRHPSSLLRQALDALSRVRNDLERGIGEQWCEAHPDRPLYVDGSVRTSHAMMRATGVVGVVKSHATLYVPDDAVPLVTSLAGGQRTSGIVALDEAQRPRFLTWYLRLRSAAGRDPFFGLIRVECGVREADAPACEAVADRISAWLLAERAPIARPDARWDVMPYAVRDCEVYLRAVA